MKPFWISCMILIAMATLLLFNAQHLKKLIEPMQEQLTEAGEYAKNGDWEKAKQITNQVHETWHTKRMYLHVTLPHSNIDQIYMLMDEALAYLENQKIGEYSAVNQTLISQLDLLYGMEALTMNNIL